MLTETCYIFIISSPEVSVSVLFSRLISVGRISLSCSDAVGAQEGVPGGTVAGTCCGAGEGDQVEKREVSGAWQVGPEGAPGSDGQGAGPSNQLSLCRSTQGSLPS